jgi:hypothetical protein
MILNLMLVLWRVQGGSAGLPQAHNAIRILLAETTESVIDMIVTKNTEGGWKRVQDSWVQQARVRKILFMPRNGVEVANSPTKDTGVQHVPKHDRSGQGSKYID